MSRSCATTRVPSLFVLMTCVLLAHVAAAQGLTGALIGTVKDGEGGVVPGAVLRITSPALIGRELRTTTNEKGQLRFPALPPGSYALDVETVQMLERLARQSVTVQGAGSRIEARGSGLETRLRSEDLRAIPTGRFSMFDLVRTAPGISPTSASGTTTTVSARSGRANFRCQTPLWECAISSTGISGPTTRDGRRRCRRRTCLETTPSRP